MLKDCKVYLSYCCDDPLAQYSFIGWKARDEDGNQFGSVFKIPLEIHEEFFRQLKETICHTRDLSRI